jgi:hypothetical protein
MMSLAVFVSLFFLYSLISRRLEQTVVTAPIVFTVAGMLMFPALPAILKFGVNAGVLSGRLIPACRNRFGAAPFHGRQPHEHDCTAVRRKFGCALVERWDAADHPARCSRLLHTRRNADYRSHTQV